MCSFTTVIFMRRWGPNKSWKHCNYNSMTQPFSERLMVAGKYLIFWIHLMWRLKEIVFQRRRERTAMRVFALHEANPSFIPSIIHGLPSTTSTGHQVHKKNPVHCQATKKQTKPNQNKMEKKWYFVTEGCLEIKYAYT